MEISYKRDGTQNFMIIRGQSVSEGDYKLQMVLHNKIDGLIPPNIRMVNNEPEIYYDVTTMISLESMFAKKQMSGKDVYELVYAIKKLSERLREYLLDMNHILFRPELVYVTKKEKKYSFCYFPEDMGIYQKGLRAFFDKLLEYIHHEDQIAVLIAYGIQQLTIGDMFTIQDLMDCAKKYVRDKITEKQGAAKAHYGENRPEQIELETAKKADIPQGEKAIKKKKAQKGFITKLKSLFGEKNHFQDEAALKSQDYDFYEESISEVDDGETQMLTAYDLQDEDATMLLTGNGAIPFLVLRSEEGDGREDIIPKTFPCIVGKSEKSSDCYVNSPVVSRVHMRILSEASGYYVEDLNSTNGTFVNGDKLPPHEPREIHAGDRVTLANLDFTVEQNEGEWYNE